MNPRATHLKIKLKTLAAEARFIRLEERKALRAARAAAPEDRPPRQRAFDALREHRLGVVRVQARLTHLAHGFLRGHAYAVMEARCARPPDFDAVAKVARRFGSADDIERWAAWVAAAKAHLAPVLEEVA